MLDNVLLIKTLADLMLSLRISDPFLWIIMHRICGAISLNRELD
jgi:hypothetical protein